MEGYTPSEGHRMYKRKMCELAIMIFREKILLYEQATNSKEKIKILEEIQDAMRIVASYKTYYLLAHMKNVVLRCRREVQAGYPQTNSLMKFIKEKELVSISGV